MQHIHKVLDICVDLRNRADELLKLRQELPLDTQEDMAEFTRVNMMRLKIQNTYEYLLEIYSDQLQSVDLRKETTN